MIPLIRTSMIACLVGMTLLGFTLAAVCGHGYFAEAEARATVEEVPVLTVPEVRSTAESVDHAAAAPADAKKQATRNDVLTVPEVRSIDDADANEEQATMTWPRAPEVRSIDDAAAHEEQATMTWAGAPEVSPVEIVQE